MLTVSKYEQEKQAKREAALAITNEKRATALATIYAQLVAGGHEVEVGMVSRWNGQFGVISRVDGVAVDIDIVPAEERRFNAPPTNIVRCKLGVGYDHVANYPEGKNGLSVAKIASAIESAVATKNAERRAEEERRALYARLETKRDEVAPAAGRVVANIKASGVDAAAEATPGGIKMTLRGLTEEQANAVLMLLASAKAVS